MKHLLIAGLLTLSLVAAAQRVAAAETSTGPTAVVSTSPRAKSMPFNGEVKAVDKEAQTLTLVGKERDRVFRINQATKIHDAGEPKTLEDVKVGRRVGGRAEANADGEWVITTLNLGVKQAN